MASQKSSRHVRSISDCSDIQLAVYQNCVEKLDESMRFAGFEEADLRGIRDFRDIEDKVEMVKESLRWIINERQQPGRIANVSVCEHIITAAHQLTVFYKARTFSEFNNLDYVTELGVVFDTVMAKDTFYASLHNTFERADLEKHKTSVDEWNSDFLKEMLALIDKHVSPKVCDSVLLFCSNAY